MSPLKLVALAALTVMIAAALCQGLPAPPIPCCTRVSKHIPKNLLKQVTKFRLQKKDGICNLSAVVLYVGNEQKCLDPQNRSLKLWMKKFRSSKKS